MEQKIITQPKQKRSVETKKKIKKAAKALFAEKGYYTVTSNNIAAEAKVPIGSFYNYFGNKKGVLLELIRDFNEQFHADGIHAVTDAIVEIKSAADVLPFIEMALKRNLLSGSLADPFYRIIHALQFTEPDVLQLSEEIRAIEIDSLTQFLKHIEPFYPVQNIPLTAKLMHSTAENVALYIHHLGSIHAQDELIKETARMIWSYIADFKTIHNFSII